MNARTAAGLAAAAQVALLLFIAGRYQIERELDPHVLIEVLPVDPDSPLKGRYLTLRAQGQDEIAAKSVMEPVRLEASAGRLYVIADAKGSVMAAIQDCGASRCWVLQQPLAFFIPEHAADPSRAHTPLWVDATLPKHGPPRPVALMREGPGGHFSALPLR